MTGLGALDTLYQTFLGQTNEALNEPPAPWQQELMETVNPDKVRRQNIKRALAQASMALATTPGNFLTGLSAAAGTGANAYLTAQDDSEQQRMKVMQLVQTAQQKDRDRRLALLQDALGVGRNLQSDKIAEDDRQYRRGRDAKSDARQERLDNSLIESRKRPRGSSSTGGLTDNQIGVYRRDIRRQMEVERRRLEDAAEMDETLTPEVIEQQVDDLRRELEDYYGIGEEEGGAPPPTVGPSVSTRQDGILPATAPPPLEQRIVGKTYATPKGNFIWTGSGWKPVL